MSRHGSIASSPARSRSRSALPPQPGKKLAEISWRRRLQLDPPVVVRMPEDQAPGMQRVPWKGNRPQLVGAEHVPPFADERVAAQPRLDPHLVSAAGLQADLEQ